MAYVFSCVSMLLQSAGSSFIHQLFHVLLPWNVNPFLVYYHFSWYTFQRVGPRYILSFFYSLLCYSKYFILMVRSFKSLLHSFCFFPFAKEITLFAFCLLFLYSFHAFVDCSFFPVSVLFFYSLTASATSSFHQHVSCCRCSFTSEYFHSASSTFSLTMLWYSSRLFLLELPFTHSWFKLLMPSFN